MNAPAIASVLRDTELAFDRAGLSDGADTIRTLRRRLHREQAHVAFVGPFKTGKGALVNSVLHADVCPSDVDVVTTSTIYVSHPAHTDGHDDRPVAPGNSADTGSIVHAQADRALLERGLVLIDTPGVAGVGSVEHESVLQTCGEADAVIYVTNAARELTASDLAVMGSMRQLTTIAAIVMNKYDLCPDAVQVRNRNLEILSQHGLDVPVLITSGALRRIGVADSDEELDELSGVGSLVRLLAGEVLASARASHLESVCRHASRVIDQERFHIEHKERALIEPSEAVKDLEATQQRLQATRSEGAMWRRELEEGLASSVSSTVEELRRSLRKTSDLITEEIDSCDPRRSWQEVESQLRRQVREAVLDLQTDMTARTQAAARQAAERLATELEDLSLHSDESESIDLDDAPVEIDFRRESVIDTAMSGLRGAYLPGMMLTAVASSVGVGLTAATGGLVVVAALALGGRSFQRERERQIENTRRVARAACQRYLDDVLAEVQRSLRTGAAETRAGIVARFEDYMRALEERATEAVTTARRAAQLDQAARNREIGELRATTQQIRRLESVLADAIGRPGS